MRTVLIATGYAPQLEAITTETSAPMLPLMGKPFLQHLVEVLVGQGCRQLDIFLHEHPDQIEELLRSGQRWGASFTFHICRSSTHFSDKLALLARTDGEGLRLVFGDRLAAEAYAGLFATEVAADMPVRVAGCCADGKIEPVWAVVSCGWFALPGAAGADSNTIETVVAAAKACGGLIEVGQPLLWQTYADLLATTRRVMDGAGPELLITGRVTDACVWLGRNVSLHPTAHLEPPVFVGPDCEIGAGVSLGPYVAIEGNCVLDRGCAVRQSLVFRNTYVGEALELEDVVATAKMIANARYNAVVPVPDEFLLGSLKVGLMRQGAAKIASRLFGLGLLVALTPCWIIGFLLWLAGGVKFWPARLACVRLPAGDHPMFWKSFRYSAMLGGSEREGRHFFSRFMPGLVSVVKGDLALVGVPPRSRQEVECMPVDWRHIYLRGTCGLIVEPGVIYSTRRSADEAFAADACFVANPSVTHEFILLCRYLFSRRLVSRLRGRSARRSKNEVQS